MPLYILDLLAIRETKLKIQLFFCAVYSAQNPGCLKLNAVALSTRHPREDVFLTSRELQNHDK